MERYVLSLWKKLGVRAFNFFKTLFKSSREMILNPLRHRRLAELIGSLLSFQGAGVKIIGAV